MSETMRRANPGLLELALTFNHIAGFFGGGLSAWLPKSSWSKMLAEGGVP
jgi:hypothetical protein